MVVPRPSLPQVLVSDETPPLLAQVEVILSEAGYAVAAAPALPVALALVEEQLFHFILTDVFAQPGLPPFQGIAPLNAQAQPTPIGVMTALPLSAASANQAGVSYLLPKPFRVADLLEVVERGVQSSLRTPPEQEVQRQVVEAFFRAWSAEEWVQIVQLCTPWVRFLPPPPLEQERPAWGGLDTLLGYLQRRVRALPDWQVEQTRVYPVSDGLVARYQARWVDRQGAIHQVTGELRFTFEGTRFGEVRGGAANLTPPLWESGRSAGPVLEGQARRQAERSRTLPTLRATLEGVGRLRLCRIVDKQGVIWSAEELIEWLEWQAPEQLWLPVTLVHPTRERAAPDGQHLFSALPPLTGGRRAAGRVVPDIWRPCGAPPGCHAR